MTRSANGRPLRFFAMVMTGWIMLRIFSPGGPPYFPSQPPPLLARTQMASIAPTAILDASAFAALPAPSRAGASNRIGVTRSAPALHGETIATGNLDDMPVDLMEFISFTVGFANRHYASDAEDMGSLHALSASPPPLLTAHGTDRWRAASWLLWRPGGGGKAVSTGQLGGSQAGIRVDYDLAPRARSRIAAYGRLTSALRHPAAPESAIGLSIQPIRAIPVSVAAERRIALGTGGRNANSVMAVGGFGPTEIAPSIAAEAYGQAGVVGFKRKDMFIDGKLSLSASLPQSPFRLGAALSGGAQPDVGRLDIGPELQVRLPLPRTTVRIAVEWRARIAGDARPGSGLAITLAADF